MGTSGEEYIGGIGGNIDGYSSNELCESELCPTLVLGLEVDGTEASIIQKPLSLSHA